MEIEPDKTKFSNDDSITELRAISNKSKTL